MWCLIVSIPDICPLSYLGCPIAGVCNCSMYCCTLLYVHSSIAIILMGKRELIALLNLSSWCLVMVERLFLAVPRGCLQFVIVVLPDHTHLLFLRQSACLVLSPIMVYSYGFLFNCTTVGQASDSMLALTQNFNRWVGAWCLSVAGPTVAQL